MIDRGDIEKKLEQTKRLSILAGDYTTRQRRLEFRDELIEAFRNFPQRRELISEQSVRLRARELWEQHGCPLGRDEEFWLRAERELIQASRSIPERDVNTICS